jgi:hypothetical protein
VSAPPERALCDSCHPQPMWATIASRAADACSRRSHIFPRRCSALSTSASVTCGPVCFLFLWFLYGLRLHRHILVGHLFEQSHRSYSHTARATCREYRTNASLRCCGALQVAQTGAGWRSSPRPRMTRSPIHIVTRPPATALLYDPFADATARQSAPVTSISLASARSGRIRRLRQYADSKRDDALESDDKRSARCRSWHRLGAFVRRRRYQDRDLLRRPPHESQGRRVGLSQAQLVAAFSRICIASNRGRLRQHRNCR